MGEISDRISDNKCSKDMAEKALKILQLNDATKEE